MFEDIRNFLPFSEHLFTGGMPKAEQLTDAAQRGVELVINLAPHDALDALPNEKELVTSLGMQYINIPVNWSTPTQDGLDRFLRAMDENEGKKILVHCQANFRASAFASLYRILRQGWKAEDAMEVMHTIWDEEDYPMWKLFIEETLKKSREGS
ncbi:MAG TPA: protein tyrosine phosphatase family protein [Anaerolineales bacterium]|nr:protein tyrosine phosphatase family protein [Anaerolineales bacterium]